MIEFIYWSGYAIVLVSLIVLSAWVLANDDNKDFMDLLLGLLIMPFFSWLLILIILLALGFEAVKETE